MNYSEKSLYQCHFMHHKSHMDSPDIEPGTLRREASHYSTDARRCRNVIQIDQRLGETYPDEGGRNFLRNVDK